jgi:dethiobiotin synthetase
MALNYLITSGEPGVGKTMIGCALAFAFKVRGMRVGVMKPVETGCAALFPADGAALLFAASANLALAQVSPYRYRSRLPPAAAAHADGADAPDFAAICRCYREISAASDATIVEDAGGLTASIDGRHSYADLALELGLEIILVVTNRGAFAGAAALNLEYAANRRLAMRGYILNALDREGSLALDRDAEMVARITAVPSIGKIRFKQPLGLDIVERVL